MTKYYLAFDKGQGKRSDNADRYEIINISRFVKNGYFTKVADITKFTKDYKSYSELFLSLYANEMVSAEFAGEPFTICYQGRNDKEWKHLGTNKYVKENKIFFKDDAYLVDAPSEEMLKSTYYTLEVQKFDSIDRKAYVRFNLTNELLGQELSIPKFWSYETAPQYDKDCFDFLTKFTEEIKTIINAKKRTSVYANQTNYASYINYIESYNNDLILYLKYAKSYGDVQPKFFELPVKKIVHMLCTGKDAKHETLRVDNTQLFNLATLYTNFYSDRNRRFKKEAALLKEEIAKLENRKNNLFDTSQAEYVQIDMWGNEHPAEEFTRKRKK